MTFHSDHLLYTDILAFCEFSFGPVIIIIIIIIIITDPPGSTVWRVQRAGAERRGVGRARFTGVGRARARGRGP